MWVLNVSIPLWILIFMALAFAFLGSFLDECRYGFQGIRCEPSVSVLNRQFFYGLQTMSIANPRQTNDY